MSTKKIVFPLTVLTALIIFSCQKDEAPGSASFEITDAPTDDANVKAVFVTISDIKVDGQSIGGFNETTLDISAYSNGATKLLANTDLDAKSYSEITLILDYDYDEDGNAPGCYVEEMDGTKHKLLTSGNEITIEHNFDIESETQTGLIIDFDLRKCIVREESGDDHYEFVTKAEMESNLRIIGKTQAGIIKGNCSDLVSASDKIVVYAYKKGDFDRSTEIQGQGTSKIEFSNAITSATVSANGDYELHFLEAGDYEIHFASYEENVDGEMELTGTLSVNVLGSINIGSISVAAAASVIVDVIVIGLLPI